MADAVTLPEPLGRGRPSKEERERYDRELELFAGGLKRIQRTQLNGPIGKRSWCYYLESEGIITKDEFDKIDNLIDKARKKGYLPLTFLADDDACEFSTKLTKNEPADPVEVAKNSARRAIGTLKRAGTDYTIGNNTLWHHYARIHPWMLVEKIDLKTEVFGPVCEEYGVPIANARGQPNITTRGKLRKYFKEAYRSDCKPVLLYAGDHDPDGLQMADEEAWKAKFRELRNEPWIDSLKVIHVAITADFIRKHGIDWIPNLESSNGRERQASDGEFVKNYLERYGRRKVEANSLVVPEYREPAQEELRQTLDDLLGDAKKRLEQDKEKNQKKAEKAVENIPVDEIEDLIVDAIEGGIDDV